jgi:hypothetical protein
VGADRVRLGERSWVIRLAPAGRSDVGDADG